MESPVPLPTLGRIVLVTFDKNAPVVGSPPSIVTRPADVVAIFTPGPPFHVNLVAKLDGPNDTPPSEHRFGAPCTRWLGSVPYDPDPNTNKIPSWRYPPRV